jgi:hypothetical protein
MSKGIHVSTLIGLIIAVLILILFAPMLIRAAKGVWDQILQALGIVKPTALEKAIECSYYRCIEGCLSYKVTDEIEWEDNGRTVKCNEFCNIPDEFRPSDNKICGWIAMQYPVELSSFSSDKEIGKQIGDIKFDCIIPGDSSKIGLNQQKLAFMIGAGIAGFGGVSLCIASLATFETIVGPIVGCGIALGSTIYFIVTGKTYYNNIFIPDASIIAHRTTTTCEKSGFDVGTIEDAIDTFKVSTNKKLYIYTDHAKDEFIIQYGDRRLTTISTWPTYITIPTNEQEFTFNFTTTNNFLRIETPEEMVAFKVAEIANDYATVEFKSSTDRKSSQLSLSAPSDSIRIKNNYYFYVTFSKIYIYTDQKVVELKLKVSSTPPVQPIVKQPTDGDQWTEDQQFLGYWSASGAPLDLSNDKQVGQKSVHTTIQLPWEIRFKLRKAGISLKPAEYPYMHFYFKTDKTPVEGAGVSIKLKGIQFYCTWPIYQVVEKDKWVEVKIDLSKNPWSSTKDYNSWYDCNSFQYFANGGDNHCCDEIEEIMFVGFDGNVWIDSLYFFK